jgi:hypothetical protein
LPAGFAGGLGREFFGGFFGRAASSGERHEDTVTPPTN